MEDDDISTCDYDSDTPIYVGHGPLRAQQDDKDNDDDDGLSCKAIDDPVPVRDSNGLLQAESNLEQDEKQGTLPLATCLVSRETKLGDNLSACVEHGMESCETPKNASSEMPLTSKWHADDDDSLDWTRDSGCNWVDEYSDNDDNDDEICVGHEGKSSESLTKNEVVKSNGYCEISSFGNLSKKDYSFAEIAKNKNLDYVHVYSSSPLNVLQSEHLPRCNTSTGSDLDRTCKENVKKCCELEDLSCKNENSKSPGEQKHQKLSESELQRSSGVSKDETVECQNTLEHSPVGKSYSLRTKRKRNCFLEGFVTSKPTCRSPAKNVGGRDPKITCKEQKENEGLNSSVTRRTSPRKGDRNDQLEDHSQKKSTSVHVGGRDPKITCREHKEKEGLNLAVTRRTSPRKRDRNDQPEDHSQRKIVSSVCDENLNSKDLTMVGDQDHDSLQGKDRRSTSTARRRIENTDILDPSSDLDAEVDDCEPVSSQIFTGAPMFSRNTKTKKQSSRGEGSVCLTLEDVSAAGEGTHLDAVERVGSIAPEPELEEDQSTTRKDSKKCIGAKSPCPDVLRTSSRQRRRKRSCQEQSERIVTGNERIDAETGKEDRVVTKTRRTNKKCETSKEEKCLKNMDNVTDDQVMPPTNASVESPLQTAHLVLNGASTEENDKEPLDNLEKCDGPTPPEVKRPIYRARRCRSTCKGRKSANDLINILTAASASALKRASELSSTPSSKENQESIRTDQKVASKKRRSSSRKARVTKPRQSRKRKHPSCSPEEDDLQTSDPVKGGGDEIISACQKADKPSNLTTSVDPSLEQHAAMLRYDSVSHDDDSGDDDDELMNPVLTPDSKTRDLPPAFSVNEVVWAQDPGDKSRWPAVVIEVAGENVSRRVYNVFKTHQTKEHYFQVKCSRYLKPYNCREKETYLEKGKGLTEFNNAVERANDFIMKIGLGKVNSYEDFFKPTDAYLDSPPPSPDYSSVPSPPLIVGHSSPEYPHHTPKINQHEVVDVEDDDDDEEDEEEEGDLNNSLNSVKNNCNGASKEITRLKRKWQRKEKRLLEHMRSVQTKKYLVDIQHGKVPSERHQWFVSSNPSDKGRLLRGSFGALINEKKRFETVNYLRNLLTSDKSLLSSPRYMMEVALPEALNFAYQKTCRIGKADAEQLIHRDGQQVIRDLDIG